MANLPISGLTASASNLASTDLAPVVQTVGVGPVKMTGLQLAGGLLGSTTFNGSTVTTSSPVLNLTQTWNAGAVTFTGLRFNAAGSSDANSAAGSLLLDLQVGGASKLNVTKAGNITMAGTSFSTLGAGINFVGGYFTFSNQIYARGTPPISLGSSDDVILSRAAAATLQLGAADTSAAATVTITIATPGVVTWSSHGLSTGTPVVFSTTGALPTGITAGTTYYVIVVDANSFQIATSYANATAVSPTAVNTSGSQSGTHTGTRGAVDQIFRVQSASGTANFPGADFAIQGSRGTGTGAGGSIIFQVAPAGSAGSSQNAYITALTINGTDGSLSHRTDNSTGLALTITGPTSTPVIIAGNSGFRPGSIILGFNASPGTGVAFSNSATGASPAAGAFSTGFVISAASYFGWTSNTLSSTVDTFLYRDTTSTLALRNGNSTGAAQRFNVYNTYTSSTNYETFKVDWITTANTCLIGTEKGSGGGTARDLRVDVAGSVFDVNIAGARQLYVSASWTQIDSGRLDIPGTSAQIKLGGTGVTALMIKRSSATLQVRLADDSAFGSFQTGGFSGGAPTIKTANYTQLEADYSLIFNGTGSITLTLLAAATYPGKILYVKTIAAQTVVSASSNVKPIDTDTAGTAILAATAGKWAMLQSDGTNWVIMAQG